MTHVPFFQTLPWPCRTGICNDSTPSVKTCVRVCVSGQAVPRSIRLDCPSTARSTTHPPTMLAYPPTALPQHTITHAHTQPGTHTHIRTHITAAAAEHGDTRGLRAPLGRCLEYHHRRQLVPTNGNEATAPLHIQPKKNKIKKYLETEEMVTRWDLAAGPHLGFGSQTCACHSVVSLLPCISGVRSPQKGTSQWVLCGRWQWSQ